MPWKKHAPALLAALVVTAAPFLVRCGAFDSDDPAVVPDAGGAEAATTDGGGQADADGGDPSPPPLTDCAFWFRADQGVTVGASGGVARWDSQCPGGAITSLTAPANAGTVARTTLRGRPALGFRAADPAAVNGPSLQTPEGPLRSPIGIYAVFAIDGFNERGNVVSWNGDSGFDLFVAKPRKVVFLTFAGNVTQSLTEATIADAPAVYVALAESEGGTTRVYVDSPDAAPSVTTTDGAAPQTAKGLVLGASSAGNGVMVGDLAEVLAYSRIHTPDERRRVFAYLTARYRN